MSARLGRKFWQPLVMVPLAFAIAPVACALFASLMIVGLADPADPYVSPWPTIAIVYEIALFFALLVGVPVMTVTGASRRLTLGLCVKGAAITGAVGISPFLVFLVSAGRADEWLRALPAFLLVELGAVLSGMLFWLILHGTGTLRLLNEDSGA